MIMSCGLTVSILSVYLNAAFAGDDAQGSQNAQQKKCSISTLVKGCSDREQRTSQAISQLMDSLNSASKTDDPAKMKAALEDAKKSLAEMKADHDKSGDALKKVHKRLLSLKEQLKTTREQHAKTSDMIENEDMDDVIWAY